MSEPKKIRVVNYAVNGRGVGHLTRLVAINRWVRRYAAYRAWVVGGGRALLEERFALLQGERPPR